MLKSPFPERLSWLNKEYAAHFHGNEWTLHETTDSGSADLVCMFEGDMDRVVLSRLRNLQCPWLANKKIADAILFERFPETNSYVVRITAAPRPR